MPEIITCRGNPSRMIIGCATMTNLERIVAYIAFNAVKAGLVRQPQEWRFSSSHDQFLQDGDGWLRWDRGAGGSPAS